ncbi:unnamed protein product [Cercopithifilaria johnstoni]|uniref:Forkhead box protein K1 n=1 Tax=Cercopithifilaria johnstoni TaxID=2874296 RepID=A0A8J2Q198_9BILA|nr:unnamed protein product [Cercopithifilaria johnstoni]
MITIRGFTSYTNFKHKLFYLVRTGSCVLALTSVLIYYHYILHPSATHVAERHYKLERYFADCTGRSQLSAKMGSSSELDELSSGDEMCNRAVISVSAVEAAINSAIRQHQTLKTGQSNIDTRVPLIKEQLGIRANNLTGGLCKDVQWIGEPTFHPLAVIWGRKGPFVISKEVVIVGRDSANSIADFVVQEGNYVSRCHFILFYNGQPNKWNIKVNGKNGVFVNEIMYAQSEQAESIPISCIFRFPSTRISMLFCGMEPLPATGNTIFSIVRMTGNEIDSAISLADSEKTFHLSDKSHEEENTSTLTTEHSEPIQIPPHGSAGANVNTGSPSSISTSDSDQNYREDCEASNEKPPYSYAQLIVQAILSSPDQQMTLSGIYNYITSRYPWYRSADKSWQNSILHNLALNRYFVKVARSQEEPGKGSFWRMESSSVPRSVELAHKKRKPKLLIGNIVSSFVIDNNPESVEDTMVAIETRKVLAFEVEEVEPDSHSSDEQLISDPEMGEETLTLSNGSPRSICSNNSRGSFSNGGNESSSTISSYSIAKLNARDGNLNYFEVGMGMFGLTRITFEVGDVESGCFGRMDISPSADIQFPLAEPVFPLHHPRSYISSDNSHHFEKDTAIFSVEENDVLREEDMLRLAHSAPCSPKNVLSRSEFRSCGATFRVRQSAKDGRSRLQLCPSAPEYRSALSLSSDALHQITSYPRNETKSLSTTPVQEMLQDSSGLKLEDLSRDFIMMSDSNDPQYHQVNGKEAQPRHRSRRQNLTYSARVEPFVSEKMIVASSSKAHSYTGPEQPHSSSFKTSGVQQVIGIENYGEDSKIVGNEIIEEDGCLKYLPIMRKYGVDESVKLNTKMKPLPREKFVRDMLIQRKRTYVEAVASGEVQKEYHKVTKKPKQTYEISTHPTERMMAIKRKKTIGKQLASGNPLLTLPPRVKSEATIATNSNFLAQQLQTADHMNEDPFYSNTVETGSILDKLRNKSCTEMSSQQQSNLAADLNSQPHISTSAMAHLSDSWKRTIEAIEELAEIRQYLLEKSSMPDTLQPPQPVNAPVTEAASQNLPTFSSLLSDAALMTAISQLEAATYMQYQLKIQQITASAESSEYFSNYIDYIKMLLGVPVSQSQSQSSNLFAAANGEQQHHQNLQELQPQFPFPNYSFPATFPANNPFLDRNLNLNIGQWFDYMRLLAIQSSSAGLCMPPFATPMWNPLSLIALKNACAAAPIFSNLQKELTDLMTQRNNANVCGNNGAQCPNCSNVASKSNLHSAQ